MSGKLNMHVTNESFRAFQRCTKISRNSSIQTLMDVDDIITLIGQLCYFFHCLQRNIALL